MKHPTQDEIREAAEAYYVEASGRSIEYAAPEELEAFEGGVKWLLSRPQGDEPGSGEEGGRSLFDGEDKDLPMELFSHGIDPDDGAIAAYRLGRASQAVRVGELLRMLEWCRQDFAAAGMKDNQAELALFLSQHRGGA